MLFKNANIEKKFKQNKKSTLDNSYFPKSSSMGTTDVNTFSNRDTFNSTLKHNPKIFNDIYESQMMNDNVRNSEHCKDEHSCHGQI